MLFKVNPDKHMIRALIQFWDPDRVVFTFKDFELTYIGRNILFHELEVSRKRSNYSSQSIREEISSVLRTEK